jgi:hypothetical protein
MRTDAARFAYADPPYLGCGKARYGSEHPQAAIWDDPSTHVALVKQLIEDYPDGWAISCNPRDLAMYLAECPSDVRVGAWVKTFHQIRPTMTQFAWEPVIWRTVRKGRRSPMVRDWLACPATRKKGLVGAKPEAFNNWVLDLLGFRPGDVVDDIFPGTGGMGHAALARSEVVPDED